VGFPTTESCTEANGRPTLFGSSDPVKHGLDDFAELLRRVGVLEKRGCFSIHPGSLVSNEITKICRKDGVIEIAFENFLPWCASG
jgi:hypothetical protein